MQIHVRIRSRLFPFIRSLSAVRSAPGITCAKKFGKIRFIHMKRAVQRALRNSNARIAARRYCALSSPPARSVHSVHAPAGIFLLQTRKASSRRVRVARAASHSLPRTLRALPRQHRPGSLAPESALIPTDSAPPPPTPAGPAVAGHGPAPARARPPASGGKEVPIPPPPPSSPALFSQPPVAP